MAWSQTDLDRLDAALSKNILEVRFADGRLMRYQNADQMLAVRREMKAELKAASSQVVRATRGTMRRP